jgi:hypothetical protein
VAELTVRAQGDTGKTVVRSLVAGLVEALDVVVARVARVLGAAPLLAAVHSVAEQFVFARASVRLGRPGVGSRDSITDLAKLIRTGGAIRVANAVDEAAGAAPLASVGVLVALVVLRAG